MSYADNLVESAQNIVGFPGYLFNEGTDILQHGVMIPTDLVKKSVFTPWKNVGPRFRDKADAAPTAATVAANTALGKKMRKSKSPKKHHSKSHGKKHAKKSARKSKKSKSPKKHHHAMLRYRPKSAKACKKRHMDWNSKTKRCNKSE